MVLFFTHKPNRHKAGIKRTQRKLGPFLYPQVNRVKGGEKKAQPKGWAFIRIKTGSRPRVRAAVFNELE